MCGLKSIHIHSLSLTHTHTLALFSLFTHTLSLSHTLLHLHPYSLGPLERAVLTVEESLAPVTAKRTVSQEESELPFKQE